MWKTCQETVFVTDDLKALLATGIAALLSQLKPHCVTGEFRSTGVRHFDALTREQQFMALHEIAVALLQDDVVPPEPVAYRQAALLAVFDCIERGILSEILENTNAFRSLILKAHQGLYGTIDHGLAVASPDVDRWQTLVLSIRKKLLDGWTLEISDRIIDLPLGVTVEWMDKNNIPRDYFIAVPEDPVFFHTAALAMKTYELCANHLVEYMQGSIRRIRCSVASG